MHETVASGAENARTGPLTAPRRDLDLPAKPELGRALLRPLAVALAAAFCSPAPSIAAVVTRSSVTSAAGQTALRRWRKHSCCRHLLFQARKFMACRRTWAKARAGGISILPPMISIYAPVLLARAAFIASSSSPSVPTRAVYQFAHPSAVGNRHSSKAPGRCTSSSDFPPVPAR
jgi:hypothetical protein